MSYLGRACKTYLKHCKIKSIYFIHFSFHESDYVFPHPRNLYLVFFLESSIFTEIFSFTNFQSIFHLLSDTLDSNQCKHNLILFIYFGARIQRIHVNLLSREIVKWDILIFSDFINKLLYIFIHLLKKQYYFKRLRKKKIINIWYHLTPSTIQFSTKCSQ